MLGGCQRKVNGYVCWYWPRETKERKDEANQQTAVTRKWKRLSEDCLSFVLVGHEKKNLLGRLIDRQSTYTQPHVALAFCRPHNHMLFPQVKEEFLLYRLLWSLLLSIVSAAVKKEKDRAAETIDRRRDQSNLMDITKDQKVRNRR